jgi:hypothetical protein
VLAAQGKIPFRTFLFSNVGEDSEHPATLEYVGNVAVPFAKEHGIELVELRRVKRDGTEETLWGRLMREDSRSLPIPVRMSNGAPGARSCTVDFKIRVIAKELKRRGATKDEPALVAIGISTDEIARAKPGIDPSEPLKERTYPLLDLGISRDDCKTIIAEAGIPVPPKSACFFCPFHDQDAWRDLRSETPELWEKAVELESTLNRRLDKLGKDHVYLTRFGVPLPRAVSELSGLYDGLDGCDSGHCMT